MKKTFFLFCILFSSAQLFAQYSFTWLDLPPMPVRVSNNAVASAFDGNSTCVYSFGGIDSTKAYSGIHRKSFKYHVGTQHWQQIPDLPDTLGKIASAASVVKNKIYIIGGYHVFQNGNETSSNKVHIFNPLSNQFEADGANIPVPIDDHVQVVWRDSLIFVVTGWSNTGNVADVQIYNPALNTWTSGTPVPNSTLYKAFGASGVIIGDTIYYNGGVKTGSEFVATPFLRKGIINPFDPTQISWFQETNNPGASEYRSAAASFQQHLFWIGGAGTAYNYDGIAYNGTGGVQALNRILAYDASTEQWTENNNQPVSVMDLRGIAQVSSNSWIIAGGMTTNQTVSNYVHLLRLESYPNALPENQANDQVRIYPNPASDILVSNQEGTFEFFDLQGNLVLKTEVKKSNFLKIDCLQAGTYLVRVNQKSYLKLIKF